MNWRLILSLLSGLSLAIIAAYYSVSGLTKLFSGSTAVLIMASVLEFTKIVVTILVHKFWSRINILQKTYFSIAILILMSITSIGIYGQLTYTYQDTSNSYEINQKEILRYETYKTQLETKIFDIKDQVQLKQDRISTLTSTRLQQETRLDSLYMRGWVTSARRTEKVIQEANKNISLETSYIDSLNSQIAQLQDSASNIDKIILDLEYDDTSTELGPLLYISEISGYDIDIVVNYLILILVVVFDPMALILLLTTQHIFEHKDNTIEVAELKEKDLMNDEPMKSIEEPVPEDITNIYDEKKLSSTTTKKDPTPVSSYKTS